MTNPHPFPGLWREQHLLVIERGCVFPQRCVCCDEEEAKQAKRLSRFQVWREAGSQLFGMVSLCEKCRRKLLVLEVAVAALMVAMVATAIQVLYYGGKTNVWFVSFLLLANISNWMLIHYRRRIKLEKLDAEKAWFSGFPPAFLAQLPDFCERRQNSRQDAGEPSGEPA